MSFVYGVLVIGALLAVIFGRHVGALFVTATATVVAVAVAVLVVAVAFALLSTPSPTYTAAPAPIFTAAPPAPPPGSYPSPTPGVVPASAAAYRGAPPAATQAAPTSAGPMMGVTIRPAAPQLSARFSMNPGFGVQVVSVRPGGPADRAGLRPGDFIQAMDYHTLTDYEARKSAGQPITLSVEHDNGIRWVHEWVKVTPQ